MSSTLVLKNVQVGNSGTPAQNMTLYQPAVPDGTVRIGTGNTGATTKDVVTFSNAGMAINGNASMNIATLTDAATVTPDFGAANNFTLTLGGNRTLANPTGLVAGQSGVIYLVQDATGSRTLAFGGNWDFPNGAAPTLTTTANAVDVLVYTVRSATSVAAVLISNIA